MAMTRKPLGAFVVTALALLSAVPVLAHHSVTAEFESSKSFSVKATITKIEWVNPNTYLYAHVKDENGTVTPYSFEGGPPCALPISRVLNILLNVANAG